MYLLVKSRKYETCVFFITHTWKYFSVMQDLISVVFASCITEITLTDLKSHCPLYLLSWDFPKLFYFLFLRLFQFITSLCSPSPFDPYQKSDIKNVKPLTQQGNTLDMEKYLETRYNREEQSALLKIFDIERLIRTNKQLWDMNNFVTQAYIRH